MKKLLDQYAFYHFWANNVIASAMKDLPEALYTQQVASSFPSLIETVQHLWNAESIWWQRMKLAEQVVPPGETFTGNWQQRLAAWLQQSEQWQQWVLAAQERMFEHEFIYYNSKKEKFKQPVYQVLMQVFNHGTYHRGQLITMMRQLNISTVPNTDFISWSRSHKAGIEKEAKKF